jgi:ribosomal protein L17
MRGNYIFSKDDHSITLYKKVKVTDQKSKNLGQEVDKLIGHYSNVESVLKKLIHLELVEKGTVKELLLDLKEVNANVTKLIRENLK